MTSADDSAPSIPTKDYEGHIPLRRGDDLTASAGDVMVNHYEGQPEVDLHFTVSSGRMSSGSIYVQLTADECRELAGALKVAAGKAPAAVAA